MDGSSVRTFRFLISNLPTGVILDNLIFSVTNTYYVQLYITFINVQDAPIIWMRKLILI